MSAQKNLEIANQFLEKLGAGAPPEEIAGLFSADLDWHIPGDDGVLPWVGHKSGRNAVAEFIRDTSEMIERLGLEIYDVLASDDRAIIFGELATRIKNTGKTIDTDFAIVLTVSDDEITQFLMLEDSFAVSVAARS